MTDKQRTIIYYALQGYTARQCSIIANVSSDYASRVLRRLEEQVVDIKGYFPGDEAISRRVMLDHIIENAELFYIPQYYRYEFISLLAYIGFSYDKLSKIFSTDSYQFIFNAMHKSGQAWRHFDPQYIGLSVEDYCSLLRIRGYVRKEDLKPN